MSVVNRIGDYFNAEQLCTFFECKWPRIWKSTFVSSGFERIRFAPGFRKELEPVVRDLGYLLSYILN